MIVIDADTKDDALRAAKNEFPCPPTKIIDKKDVGEDAPELINVDFDFLAINAKRKYICVCIPFKSRRARNAWPYSLNAVAKGYELYVFRLRLGQDSFFVKLHNFTLGPRGIITVSVALIGAAGVGIARWPWIEAFFRHNASQQVVVQAPPTAPLPPVAQVLPPASSPSPSIATAIPMIQPGREPFSEVPSTRGVKTALPSKVLVSCHASDQATFSRDLCIQLDVYKAELEYIAIRAGAKGIAITVRSESQASAFGGDSGLKTGVFDVAWLGVTRSPQTYKLLSEQTPTSWTMDQAFVEQFKRENGDEK